MSGASIKQAREALLLFLKSLLSHTARFNVIGFGSTFERLFPVPVEYNDKTLATAVEHAKRVQANLGGTELLK